MKNFLLTSLIALGIISSSFSQNFWEKVNHQMHAFHFGMADNGNVYGLSNEIFLYKSTTNGTLGSWNQVTGFPTGNSASYNIFTKGNTVFMLNGAGTLASERGVYVSTDGGSTWTTRNNGLGNNTKVAQILELADGVLLLEVTTSPNTILLYLSSDDGMNWSQGQTFNGRITSIATISSTEAYMAVENTIYRSADNGQTWLDQNSTAPSSQIPSRIVGNNNGNLLGVANDDVLESTDQGVTWTVKTLTGLPTLTSAGDKITSIRRLHGETIYAAVADNAGIFYSDDWGSTWIDITSNITSTQIFNYDIALSTDGYLFASPSGSGIFRSAERVTASTVSIKENTDVLSGFTIYPNPSTNKVFIDSDIKEGGSVEIMNQFGQVVYSNKFELLSNLNNGINISTFSNGIYFVKVKTLEGMHIQKLVKK